MLFGGAGPDGVAQLRFHASLYEPGPDACLEELWVRPDGPSMLYYERDL